MSSGHSRGRQCRMCPFVTLIAASRASFAFAWGDIPTWVTALVALLALIAAVLAYRKQSQAVNEQAEQLRDQQRVNSAQIEVLKLQQVELQQADWTVMRRRQARCVLVRR